jgi:N-acetylmuramoyl-L-alanine amidase
MTIHKLMASRHSYGGKRALSSAKGIVIHYTGNKGDSARANALYFKNSNKRAAGAHFFVDSAGEVYQSVDLSRVAWAVGGFFTQKSGAGSYYKKLTNTNTVSIELCNIADRYPSDQQIAATRELLAYIRKRCPNATKVVRHWDVNGKQCPGRMTGKNNAEWKKFLAAIGQRSAKPTAVKKASTAGKMKVIAKSGLNMRAKASASGKVIGAIPAGAWVKVVKKGKNWCKVIYAGKTGYCAAKYLK